MVTDSIQTLVNANAQSPRLQIHLVFYRTRLHTGHYLQLPKSASCEDVNPICGFVKLKLGLAARLNGLAVSPAKQ